MSKHYLIRALETSQDRNFYSVKLLAKFIRDIVRKSASEYAPFLAEVNTTVDDSTAGGNESDRLIMRVILGASSSKNFGRRG